MTQTASESSPRLLHLGCGLVAPAEWHNVDGSWGAWFAQHPVLLKFLSALHILPRSASATPWPTNIQICDVRKRLPFRDNSFDACYSSHVVEHVFRDEALALLKEMRRVLKPGGVCRTLVPDLRSIVEEYMQQRKLGTWFTEEQAAAGDDPARIFMVRMHTYMEYPPRGLRQKFYTGFGNFQLHKWMYDGPSMVKLMTEAGFTNCQEKGLHDSAIPYIDKVEMPGRVENGVGVIVEGVKPG